MRLTFFFVFLLFISSSTLATASPPPSPDRYLSSLLRRPPRQHQQQDYIELSHPLPTDRLVPSCSHLLLNHSFAYTYGQPPTSVPYAPPSTCPPPWTYVVLDLRVAVRGDQYDRIAGLWLGGVELLRTSTAEPTEDGVYWRVRKDVTKYASLLARSDLDFSVMLENLVNADFEQETKFENSIKFQNNGNDKKVKQSVTSKTEIKITNVVGEVVGQASLKRKYPLKVITSTRDMGNGTYHLFTNVDHSLKERFSSGNISSSLTNSQASDGWMLVHDHNVLSGEAKTDQSYVYIDNYSCYTRNVAAVNGQLTRDNTSFICPNYW
uniref:Peptide N-acetyl-beta-D-glucosaminyl asparaginase amidase A N-terminal domain-containing protein n=1 Tax=Kalanchoe fedtschenkoi TaxID=63787 RepID=A0A7N0UHF9_KALFE